MIRWIIYLLFSLFMQVVALFVTPLLPAFAYPRLGKVDNGNGEAVEPRLPKWLAWFDTTDNSLFGDKNWRNSHSGGYASMVMWLYRNSLYGLKWTVLAAPMTPIDVVFDGDPKINRNNGHFGVLRVKMDGYWQYKRVTPIGKTGYCWMLNFGWLLDDTDQDKALFMFSPRIVKITGVSNA